MEQRPLLITGYLGAGKSALAAAVGNAIEVPALKSPELADDDARVIAVIDAVNADTTLADAKLRPLLQAQISAAGLVVVAKADIVDPAPAIALARELTDVPVIATSKDMLSEALPEILLKIVSSTPPEPVSLEDSFSNWTYDGAAKLRADRLDAFLGDRPEGVYRMKGVVRTEKGGRLIDIAGRARFTEPVDMPSNSYLVAIGHRSELSQSDMALAFADMASSSAHLLGLFGHR